MVALVVSVLISIVMAAGIWWYSKRRAVGAIMTWGEAAVFSAYIFFLMFIVFGIVPHQWLTLAENEWSFRSDKFVYGWGDIVRPQSQGGWLPFDITRRVISDVAAALIYIVFLGIMSGMWASWQARGKAKTSTEVAKSTYGRPLVKRG